MGFTYITYFISLIHPAYLTDRLILLISWDLLSLFYPIVLSYLIYITGLTYLTYLTCLTYLTGLTYLSYFIVIIYFINPFNHAYPIYINGPTYLTCLAYLAFITYVFRIILVLITLFIQMFSLSYPSQ